MSSYATGSLTESERKLLFEAALDDQELFDQLAREQALKELIDQPGARDRLIAALAPAETSRARGAWKKPLAWGLAALFVVSMSVAALMLTRSGDQREQAEKQIAQKQGQPQIAQVNPPAVSPPVPEVTAPGSTAPSVSESATPPSSAPGAPVRSKTGALPSSADQLRDRRSTNKLEARANPESLAKKTEAAGASSGAGSSAGSIAAVRADSASPATAGQVQTTGQIAQPPAVQAQGFVAGQSQGVPRAPGLPEAQQAPQASPTRQSAQLTTGQAQAENSRLQTPQVQSGRDANGRTQTERKQVQVQTGQNQVQSGGGGGGRGGAGVGGAAGVIGGVPAAAPAHFAFDYSIDGEDLVFKFSADGYFSLHIAPGGLTIVDARVTAGSTRREHITGNGTEATIVFSASPQSAVQGVSIDTRARSGTAEDPARKRIDLLMRFY
jgi:hypothetical protein